jgi:hypothetical protein
VNGVATVGDVAAMEAAGRALAEASVPHDLAWSPVFRPDGLSLDHADPARYTHLLFVCGPLHGPDVEELHRRYKECRRVAVGVSVPDVHASAATGFDAIVPRDGVDATPRRDLSAALPAASRVPVVGVAAASAQPEYGARGRHEDVAERLLEWLRGRDCAVVPLDTRLDSRDWQKCATPAQFESVVARLDLMVTMRLHGLVFALMNGVPALAVDPIDGGAKVVDQARAWSWPAVLTAPLDDDRLERHWHWCLSAEGRAMAQERATEPAPSLYQEVARHLL